MDIPKTLKNRLCAGKVIPFIGAGVSMSANNRESGKSLFPSWNQLLHNAADRLDKELKQDDAALVRSSLEINPPDYLKAAKCAREGLKSVWYDFLKEQLDISHDTVDAESLSLAKSAWNLGSKLLITTNYDRVLKWSCPDVDALRLWDIEAPAEQAHALRDGVKHSTIWHLHGYIDNISKIILTPDGYERLYPDEAETETRYKAAIKTLHNLLASHTFLFIGFSMDDSHFGMQLRGIDAIFDGATGPHYVLVHKDSCERVKALNLPVEIIPFSDFGSPLLGLVNEMCSVAEKDNAVITSSAKTPSHVPYDPRNPVFYVPFRQKGDLVVGREEAIQTVRKQLAAGHPTAIGQTAAFHGLGGLGKTQLAVEYAYRYKDKYSNGVIWINADQDIDTQLISLANKALWIAPETEHKYKLDIAKQRLRSYSDCLIIFDNLEDVTAIKDYLPLPEANPHLLITSRTEQPDFTPIPLELLDKELSLKLLIQEAGREPDNDTDKEAAKNIVKQLDGLPLALELAGAYLRYRNTVGWQQYYDLLKQSLKEAFPAFSTIGFTKHESDIYSTLKINEKVLSEDARLSEILDLLTCSGSSPMSESLLCALLGVSNTSEITNALSLGVSLKILRKSPAKESYAIHRLVREVRHQDIQSDKRGDWVNIVCRRMGNWFQARRVEFSDLPIFEAEIDHLCQWQEIVINHSLEHASRLMWLQAYPPYHHGDYKKAKNLVEEGLVLYEKSMQKNPELEANLLNDLGSTYGDLGDYNKQLKYSKNALEIRLELFGEQHSDTAQSFNNVGHAYGNLGDHETELKYIENALKIQLDLFGEQHPNTSTCFNNVGFTYGKGGDYKKQLEYVEKALKIHLALLGEQHPNTAQLFHNLGFTYGKLGANKKALEYYEKALIIKTSLLGEQHPDTLTSACSTADALLELHRNYHALELINKFLIKLPKDNPSYSKLLTLRQQIPGFHKTSTNSPGKKKKKKRK